MEFIDNLVSAIPKISLFYKGWLLAHATENLVVDSS